MSYYDTHHYQEVKFPGKKSLGIGAAILALFWYLQWGTGLNPNDLSETDRLWLYALLVAGTALYAIGYWRAVIGKGYPRVLWLLALTGIPGFLAILFLPNKRQQANDPQQAAGDAESAWHQPQGN